MESFQTNMQNFMRISRNNNESVTIINNEGVIYHMTYDYESGRMNFKMTDKVKNYIDKITV